MKSSDSIRMLTKIFKEKHWFPKDEEDVVFDNFCELLEVLEPHERELLLELTHRYLWISGKEYDEYIRDALNMVQAKELDSVKAFYLFPIVKPGDEGKAKSGIALTYDIKAMTLMLGKYRHLTPVNLDNFDAFDKSPGTKENELLCLVDDFIGTGDTLQQCLDEIAKRMKIDYNRLIVVSISCQKETYDTLKGKGIKIFCKFVVGKGITDFNTQPAIDEKKDLMRSIEKSIPGSNSFSLGWQESEAIITLKRTPDNTFPIFWKKLKRNGKNFSAPFLRD